MITGGGSKRGGMFARFTGPALRPQSLICNPGIASARFRISLYSKDSRIRRMVSFTFAQ
jgi:hypothetical protein